MAETSGFFHPIQNSPGDVCNQEFANILFSAARAIAKGLAAHKLKEKLNTGGLTGWPKKAAVDVDTDVIENADLRCSQFLPGLIYVGDFEIEPGTYEILSSFTLPMAHWRERLCTDGSKLSKTALI